MKYYLLIDTTAHYERKQIFIEENGKCKELYLCEDGSGIYKKLVSLDHSFSIKYYNTSYWKIKEITENEAFVELL